MALHLNLKMKMLLYIGIAALISFTVTIGIVTVKADKMAKENARKSTAETALHYGGIIKAEIEIAMDTARTLAQTFEGLKQAGAIPKREATDQVLKQILEKSPTLSSVWMIWEPDALDNQDAAFKNTEGYDNSGRYAHFASRGKSGISISPLSGYETNDYYRRPKKEGRETLIDPFLGKINGKEVLMTTLGVPIRHKGKIIGVAGTSMDLQAFNERFSNVKFFDTGYLSLISNATTYVTHPKSERIGQSVLHSDPWLNAFSEKIKSGNNFIIENHSTTLGRKVLRICEPVWIGHTQTPWAVMINVPVSEILKEAKNITYTSIGIGTASLLLLIAIIYIIVNSITGPIKAGVNIAEAMATGDFSQTLHVTQNDEVGKLGTSLNHVTANIGAMIQEISTGVETLSASSTHLAAISEQMSQGADQASHRTEGVATASEEMSTSINSVAAAMAQASTNISMVAAASEEMTATINEVAKNTESARSITETAVSQAKQTRNKITELGEAAQKIGRVTETITDISDQTNLLALNATIEAARAGEAGKGFAVVATEIKELARLTALATLDIRNQIGGIQQATTVSVASIEEITTIIDEISEIVSTTATAIEEQAATTHEISQNVNQASLGLTEINENVAQGSRAADEITTDIHKVHTHAKEMTESSTTVQMSSGELLDLAAKLKKMLGQFTV